MEIKIFEAPSGKQLWAQRFERPAGDLLALRALVLASVVAQVHSRIAESSTRPTLASITSNPAAYDAYVRGQFETLQRNPDALERAVGHFEQAINLDQNFAAAYAGLAWVHLQQSSWAGKDHRRSHANQVKASISRALALDPNLAEAHTALGLAARFYDYDWLGAEAALRRAIQLKPSSTLAHSEYAILLGILRRYGDALSEADKTVALDPHTPIYWANHGFTLYRMRHYADAEASYRRALVLDSTFSGVWDRLCMLFIAQRRFREARDLLDGRMQAGGLLTLRRSQFEAASGNRAAALRLVATLKGTERLKNLTAIAGVYAVAGDHAAALGLLEQASKERLLIVGLLSDPEFDSIRSEPQFVNLVRMTGLPDDAVEKYISAPGTPVTQAANLR